MNNKYSTWGFIAGVFVLTSWIVCFSILDIHKDTWKDFGDASGVFTALGVLFTGFSFTALVITLFMQQEDLKLQKKELQHNTEALLEQKDEFIKMNKYYNKQENRNTYTLFHNNVRESIHNLSYKNPNTGRETGNVAFNYIMKDLFRGIDILNNDSSQGLETPMKSIDICIQYLDDYVENSVITIDEFDLFIEMLQSILTPDIQLSYIFFLVNNNAITTDIKDNYKKHVNIPFLQLKQNLKHIIKIHIYLLNFHFNLSSTKLSNTDKMIKILQFYNINQLRKELSVNYQQATIDKIILKFINKEQLNYEQLYLASLIAENLIYDRGKNGFDYSNKEISELIKRMHAPQL